VPVDHFAAAPAASARPPLHTELVPCPDLAELAREWDDLAGRSDGHFFTSWTWMGSWLATLPPAQRPWLLRTRAADSCDQTLGLALLGRCTVHRHGFVHSRSLFLGATGDEVLDDITIEYNQPRLDRRCATAVLQAMQDHLIHRLADWDELVLPGLDASPARLDALTRGSTGYRLLVDEKRAHRLDLDLVRQAGSLSQHLGQRLRYRLRKTRKACEAHGPLSLQAATTTDQAHDYLDRLITLHQPYWQQRGQPGAFASDYARAFHHRLVGEALARGQLQLLHIHAGTQTIGYLYNFLQDGHVYSYQSAFEHQALPSSVTPGQLCHALAIDASAQAGHRVYDFMAGDHRYKRELASHSRLMRWVVLQRPRLDLRLEHQLRLFKRQLVALRQRRSARP
jgi:hypothetical protein